MNKAFVNNMIGIQLFCIILCWSCSSDDSEKIVSNIKSFKDKTPFEIETILGKPDTSYTKNILTNKYFIQHYKSHKTDIRHLNGKVAEVILHEPENLNFRPETIEKFGFEFVEPTKYDPAAMISWKDLEGFSDISFYLVGTKNDNPSEPNFKIFFNLKK
ncbi:hypothetical protein QQ008_09795 [Fulvivirgaceae bacterium BMA10]|uniref:Lipoprotein n=1 Tax=Splendidivirga corallicola TaxID=3051826 RepID=A0ABT8KLR1_9BACT|nr:hypothetical protein [Fulvivirgaceae bacterium BMA10]